MACVVTVVSPSLVILTGAVADKSQSYDITPGDLLAQALGIYFEEGITCSICRP